MNKPPTTGALATVFVVVAAGGHKPRLGRFGPTAASRRAI